LKKNLFLILADGEMNGIGYWIIDKTFNESPALENKNILECHRKELIGEESAENILYAINHNIKNLLNDLKEEGFEVETPPKGISHSLPLDVLEKIFDFWLGLYKDKSSWDTCIGLLKIKKRISLSSIFMSKGIKVNAKKWAKIIEELHAYRPYSKKLKEQNEPMWK